jgi:hypothetical protein
MQMKQMIRSGGKERENGWINKLRWNKWVEMVGKAVEMDE